MKILLITEYYPPKIFGGGELSAQALARSLAAKGIDVSVLTATVPGQKAEEHDNGVTIYRYLRTGAHPFALWENLKRMVLFPHSLRKTLQELDKRENFDVIHCVNTTSILHFRYPKKTIATINSYVPFCPKGNLFYKEKTVCTGPAFMKCCGCIAASQYVGKTKMKVWLRWNPLLWIWLYGAYCRRKARLKHMKRLIIISTFMRAFVDKRQATLIYTIADEARQEKRRYPLPQRGVRVAYVGTLDKIKGVDIVVEAARRIGEKAQFYIVGDGPEGATLRATAGKNVTFLGQLSPELMPSIYKQVDMVMLPSRWPEPFSRVALETIYYGKPLLATKSGGNLDIVIDGITGFLCEPTAEHFAERLERLIKNMTLRKQMGKRARQLYEQKFKKDKIVAQIIDVYNH